MPAVAVSLYTLGGFGIRYGPTPSTTAGDWAQLAAAKVGTSARPGGNMAVADLTGGITRAVAA